MATFAEIKANLQTDDLHFVNILSWTEGGSPNTVTSHILLTDEPTLLTVLNAFGIATQFTTSTAQSYTLTESVTGEQTHTIAVGTITLSIAQTQSLYRIDGANEQEYINYHELSPNTDKIIYQPRLYPNSPEFEIIGLKNESNVIDTSKEGFIIIDTTVKSLNTDFETLKSDLQTITSRAFFFDKNKDLTIDNNKVDFVAGVIRNTGSGWEIISDSEHKALNVSSVSNTSGFITITYESTFSQVISLTVNPDEVYAGYGLFIGASVGLSSAVIKIYEKQYIPIRMLITKTASGFSISRLAGRELNFSITNNTYEISLTHDSFDTSEPYILGMTNTDFIFSATSTSLTSKKIRSLGFPNPNLMPTGTRFQVIFDDFKYNLIDPNSLTDAAGNFWFQGMFIK